MISSRNNTCPLALFLKNPPSTTICTHSKKGIQPLTTIITEQQGYYNLVIFLGPGGRLLARLVMEVLPVFGNNLKCWTFFPACNFDVHKKFVNRVEETCVGQSSKQRNKSRPFITRFMSDLEMPNKKLATQSPGSAGQTFCYRLYNKLPTALAIGRFSFWFIKTYPIAGLKLP